MPLPANLHLNVEDQPEAADIEALPERLEAFNQEQWPGHQHWQPLAVFVRSGEGLMAGLAGDTYAGWLFIRFLWVGQDLRRQGIGRELMEEAERRARERGCHSAWLDTFSFQARGFYEKLGYAVFATLDYPPHQRFFLRKRLVVETPGAS